MTQQYIDYGKLIDDAMHIIVRKSLEMIMNEGAIGEHHFFISFITDAKGVIVSEKLRNQYPEEMTIILQHQFDDLIVKDSFFSVSLSFDGVKENITIPFDAMTAFADPSVKFGIQFRAFEQQNEQLEQMPFGLDSNEIQEYEQITEEVIKESGADNVVSLSSMRKKKQK